MSLNDIQTVHLDAVRNTWLWLASNEGLSDTMFLIKIKLFCIVSGYYHTAASGPNVFTIEVNRYLFIYLVFFKIFIICLF